MARAEPKKNVLQKLTVLCNLQGIYPWFCPWEISVVAK